VHSGELYAEFGNWMTEDVSGLQMEANFDVRLEYYNTGSSIGLINILEILERLNKLGNKFSVRWYTDVDDEDQMDDAEVYEESSKVPFEIIKCKGWY
jgi:hypothetical protein